jgi:hypothetical protein
VPGYNKFRTVTIILVIAEMCLPILGMLLLDKLIQERETLKEKKKTFLIAIGGFAVFVLLVKFVGLGDGYSSEGDRRQISQIEDNIRKQLTTMDPQTLQQQYQLDVTNPVQVDEFVAQQAEPYLKNFDKIKVVRSAIFDASMNRTLIFVLLAGALILLFFYTSLPSTALLLAILGLTMIDSIPIAHSYLGDQEEGGKMKYWEESGKTKYPVKLQTNAHGYL